MRILVVEDEVDMNKLIVKKLKKEGYGVDSCYDGQTAIEYILASDYDAIVLDRMLPIKSGMEVVQVVRANGKMSPIIFLTAKDSISNRVEGLDAGANDYLVKPFSFEELIARIKVLTRNKANIVSNILTLGDLTMDLSSHVVKRGNNIIDLSSKEFSILEYMMHNIGIVLTREKIEDHIWNYDYEGGSNLINVYIRYLRKKIDEDYEIKLIHTIRGSGYVLRINEGK